MEGREEDAENEEIAMTMVKTDDENKRRRNEEK